MCAIISVPNEPIICNNIAIKLRLNGLGDELSLIHSLQFILATDYACYPLRDNRWS